jgi:hypothetical protein
VAAATRRPPLLLHCSCSATAAVVSLPTPPLASQGAGSLLSILGGSKRHRCRRQPSTNAGRFYCSRCRLGWGRGGLVAGSSTATSVMSGTPPARRQAAACSWWQEEQEGGRVRACQSWRADTRAVTVRNDGSVPVSHNSIPFRLGPGSLPGRRLT